jgi:hypothetical protein
MLFGSFRDGRAQGEPGKSLADYRYFRALSIDLVGRPPSDDELAAFERRDFDLERWVDEHLQGPAYAERLRRMYMDTLRLDLGSTFHFLPAQISLTWQTVLGPDGQRINVYFRHGQRRLDPITDGEVCLTREETGYDYPSRDAHGGVARPISQAVLDAKTVLVKPWWLAPGVPVVGTMRVAADGKTPVTEIRVCKEEAQTSDHGHVYASGRAQPRAGDPQPRDRPTPPPYDTAFARASKGRSVSCLSGTAYVNSAECGCGPNLERCVPVSSVFMMPGEAPLGGALPFVWGAATASEWEKMWWTEEVEHLFDRIFLDDRDFREILTGRWTEVNGPLAHFYRALAPATCCGPAAEAGYVEPEELVDAKALPRALAPADLTTWMPVADRGPHAAGILTTPVFLVKYGTPRARAHAIYSAFLCKDFVASTVKLAPSNEPDLTKRPGCSACHHKLEPMAAYFARVQESDWTWLPSNIFHTSGCTDRTSVVCTRVYDPAFGMLRGAYASPAHADVGPHGLAEEITSSPEFASCVVDTVARSFVGQPIDDPATRERLVKVFVEGGYRVRKLVREILLSQPYGRPAPGR